MNSLSKFNINITFNIDNDNNIISLKDTSQIFNNLALKDFK